jgi:type IV pilus assembly protein PilM
MLSFDITDRNIRIIKGTENNGKIRINSAATLNLEEEVIVNGHVRDVPRLATLINQVLRTNKMPDKEAIVSISSNMTIFKELHIQKAEKQSEFMKMVRAEMAAALGIDDSYSVSYIVVGDSDQTDGAVKVLATACPFEVVDCYKRVFNMLQINLRSVMIGCNCITKVLLADTKVKGKMPLLAVQIDNNFISLNLYENSQLSFSRFASISAEDYDDSEDYVFEAVNENIFRMLQFQKSKSGSEPIENVVFYGDTHEYVRLTNELEKMGIRTSIINVPPQIHGYENLEFSSYANAIGAMFKRNKDTERINLLETDTVNNNKIRSDSSYFLILGLTALLSAAACFAGWSYFAIKRRSAVKKTEVITAKQNSDLTKKLKAQLEMLGKTETKANTYLTGVRDAYNAFYSQPKPTSKMYDDIQNTIIETVADIQGTENIDEDKYIIVNIHNIAYADGVYNVEVDFARDYDVPMPITPSRVVNAIRSLSDVAECNYSGYSLSTKEVDKDANVPQQVDEDGNPVAVNNQNGDKQKMQVCAMTLNVRIKGGTIDYDTLDGKSAEEAE